VETPKHPIAKTFQPESVIRIRERLFRADEMRGARRIFEVGAGLPRPKLSQLLGAETAPPTEQKNVAATKQFAAMKIAPVRLLYRRIWI